MLAVCRTGLLNKSQRQQAVMLRRVLHVSPFLSRSPDISEEEQTTCFISPPPLATCQAINRWNQILLSAVPGAQPPDSVHPDWPAVAEP